MVKYYRIILVASKQSTIFDAIGEVANAANKYYYEILLMMGFETNEDLLDYCSRNTTPHFGKMAFVTARLNKVCKELDIPVRVIRPLTSGLRKEYV